MKKLFSMLVLAALGGAGWIFQQNFQVSGLDKVAVKPRAASNQPADVTADGDVMVPVARDRNTIRVASFNIQVFGNSKAAKPKVMNVLAETIRQFDVVAIQEIRTKSQDLLPRFVDLINSTGRHYDFVIGPRLGNTDSKEQYAFVFDTASIEVDRSSCYTVDDPDNLLHREPFVGSFRVRGPSPEQAFTFTLIDIHTDPDETVKELNALDDVFRAVRGDGRREDDVILLGDLNVDEHHLGQLGQISQIMWAIAGVPTNTRGSKTYDNIVFSQASTTEFTGRAGVFDMIRQFNLSMDDALEVSDHMPVWAEFSVYEGGQPGRVATRPGTPK
jgi:deoxyribonuclease-1-like protein